MSMADDPQSAAADSRHPIHAYMAALQAQTQAALDVALRAREQGHDPKPDVEIRLAPDVSARVEGLVGPPGVAEAIRAIKTDRESACFGIAKSILQGDFGGDEAWRLEQAVRTGLALFTEGVVSAPIEGISRVSIEQNPDGSRYAAVYFAGPIRGAGGTGQAFALIMADYCRQFLKLAEFRPMEDHVERYVEELGLYAVRTRAGQYVPSEEEIRHVVKSCPVCVAGEPTEDYEVNVRKNIPSIESNRVRSGVCLVISEGICLKAAKILKITKKHGLDWTWVERLIKVSKKQEEKTEIKPNGKYMDEIVAGRPIFSFPMKPGGFRLRYGRTRFCGIQSKAIHPATMVVLDDYPAFGTQVKTERPGKGCVVTPCETIEGPIVLLDDGEVVQVRDANQASSLKERIRTILFLGDLLVCFGDFLKSNHALVPTGFTEEEYARRLEKAGVSRTVAQIRALTFEEAVALCKEKGMSLAPQFTYYWTALTPDELRSLREWIKEKGRLDREWFEVKKAGVEGLEYKQLLEKAGVPHRLSDGTLVFDSVTAKALWMQLGILNPQDRPASGTGVMDLVNAWSEVPIRDKGGVFVGTSMGRPEKSRERKMQPPVNVLFPVGFAGGKMRDLVKAAQGPETELQLQIRLCVTCQAKTWQHQCPSCRQATQAVRQCTSCGQYTHKAKCRCGAETVSHELQRVSFHDALEKAVQVVKFKPQSLKAVIGLISANKTPEPLEKGLMRAKYELSVFRDGTCRVDATEIPITHFVPKEIGLSVEKCRALGYTHDTHGNELADESQTVELFAQDVILSQGAGDYALRVSKFIDDELVYLYGLKPYYNAQTVDDLIGQQVICIAPHTSAGITARILGFSPVQALLAHPYIHCACRRNADGDELGFLLLMDGLLNFSKEFLPETRGGKMDAPLVLTTRLDPKEVDDEVHAMDRASCYPLELYEAAARFANPSEVKMDIVADHLDKADSLYGFQCTHEAAMAGPYVTTYVKFSNMQHKVEDELALMERIAAVDAAEAAERIILNHFFPDLYGNLRSFSKQAFRCVDCNAKFRRVPLTGKCRKCNGKLLLTISKGGIQKYLKLSQTMAERFHLPEYLKQRLLLIEKEIASIFNDEQVKQFSLKEYV
ncbi:DNA polymerase II large subunit [Candidatus Micrarchaeota archaeon]|nr:DNA polymerase II large subunit [Candidatus Micrarchaeota archaeon]